MVASDRMHRRRIRVTHTGIMLKESSRSETYLTSLGIRETLSREKIGRCRVRHWKVLIVGRLPLIQGLGCLFRTRDSEVLAIKSSKVRSQWTASLLNLTVWEDALIMLWSTLTYARNHRSVAMNVWLSRESIETFRTLRSLALTEARISLLLGI